MSPGSWVIRCSASTPNPAASRETFSTPTIASGEFGRHLSASRKGKKGRQAGYRLANDNRDFIHYQALGQAILLANNKERARGMAGEPDAYREWLPTDWSRSRSSLRAVVLINEIKRAKAPRDFPNDLLAIEELRYRHPRVGQHGAPGDEGLSAGGRDHQQFREAPARRFPAGAGVPPHRLPRRR